MKSVYRIFLKEINEFLNSFIAYVVIGVFLVATGLLVWVFPETSILDYGVASMDPLFRFAPYVFLFLVPAITMRMFSEEQKQGTLELLLTHPVTQWQIIFGKFLSGLVLVLFSLLPTLIYYYSVVRLGNPPGNIDSAAVAGSYLGLLFLGGVFVSVGLFCSSLSENQIVSFVLAVFLCFIVYSGFSSLAAINVWGKLSLLLEQASILYHYDSISRGLIDSRDLVYFISVTLLMLSFTKFRMESRLW